MSKDKESPPVPSEGGESGEASDNDTSLFDFEESIDNKGLTRVFTHIVKPIANLNDPKKRKKSSVITKNIEYLSRITSENIEQAISEEQADIYRILNDFSLQLKAARQEIKEIKAGQLGHNHKFERKNGIYPLAEYPALPAAAETLVIALNTIHESAKMIKQRHPIPIREEDFLFELLNASNAIASRFKLSEKQHFKILMNAMPTYSDAKLILKNTKNIQDLFDMFSIFCSRFETSEQIEQKYAEWVPNFENIEDLKTSLWSLLALELKRDPENASDPTVWFNSLTNKLFQSNIPKEAKIKLTNLKKIVVTHPMQTNELFARILGILGQSVKTLGLPQVNQIVDSRLKHAPLGNDQQVIFRDQHLDHIRNDQHENVTPVTKRFGNFVVPWDNRTPYLDPTTFNGLTDKINEHFRGFCLRCGHNSHIGKNCRIYPSQGVVMELCYVCKQGFHKNCVSKRRDLPHNLTTAQVNTVRFVCPCIQKFQSMNNGHKKEYKKPCIP